MVQHLVHRNGKRVFLALNHDTQRISHQNRVDARLLNDAGKQGIGRRHDDDLFALPLALLDSEWSFLLLSHFRFRQNFR